MCLEDVRLGRKKSTAVSVKNTPADAYGPVVGFNKHRTHISFGTVGGNNRISPDLGEHNTFGSFVVGIALPKLEFDIETDGDVVTKPWMASGIGATGTIIIIETFLEQE